MWTICVIWEDGLWDQEDIKIPDGIIDVEESWIQNWLRGTLLAEEKYSKAIDIIYWGTHDS